MIEQRQRGLGFEDEQSGPWAKKYGLCNLESMSGPCQTCNLQKYRIITVCCFKPPNLWCFMTASSESNSEVFKVILIWRHSCKVINAKERKHG